LVPDSIDGGRFLANPINISLHVDLLSSSVAWLSLPRLDLLLKILFKHLYNELLANLGLLISVDITRRARLKPILFEYVRFKLAMVQVSRRLLLTTTF